MRRQNIRPEKIKQVDDLANLINKEKVVGILDLYKLPTSALQKIKWELRGKVMIKVAKRNVLLKALEKTNKKDLIQYVGKYPALILTETDPFRLNKFLQKNKSFVGAKTGDIVKKDIVATAGPTDLPPGPAISTLQKVGIPAKVEGGKISVIKDKTILKGGEVVSQDLASAMQLLKMEPIEIGLGIVAVFEHGAIYKGDVLSYDEEKLLNDLAIAYNQALNLCLNAGYPTRETIGLLLVKANMEAKALETSLKTEVK